MERIVTIVIIRSAELLLGIPLWQAFSPAHRLSDCIHLFLGQNQLAQVGAITIAALIVNTLYHITLDISEATRRHRPRARLRRRRSKSED